MSKKTNLKGARADSMLFRILHQHKQDLSNINIYINHGTGELQATATTYSGLVVSGRTCQSLADTLKSLYQRLNPKETT